jgi:hypothetical protein
MGMSFLLFLVIFISPWGLEPVLAEALQEPRRTFHIDYQAQWAILYNFILIFQTKTYLFT